MMTPDDPRHGTLAGYSAHRRTKVTTCKACRDAMAEYERQRQVRRYLARGGLMVPSIGIRRRLQALAALGWTLQEVDTRLGHERSYSSKLAGTTGPIYATTAAEVTALYDDLSMTVPTGWIADRQRRQAKLRGWLPPLAWDDIDDPTERPDLRDHGNRFVDRDHAVVTRFLAGEHTLPTTVPERREIVARWPGSLADLERLTGWATHRYTSNREDGAA